MRKGAQMLKRSTGIWAIAFSLTFSPIISTLASADTTPSASQSASQESGEQEASTTLSRPQHRVDEEREGGFESAQLIFVGAAIVIALGLAYRAGRRRREH